MLHPFTTTAEFILLTRPAALVLFIDISVAIVSTKIPILLGHGFWSFSLAALPRYGFWSMAHEARTDFCMWLGSLFLLLLGAGPLSLDASDALAVAICHIHTAELKRRYQQHLSSEASGR